MIDKELQARQHYARLLSSQIPRQFWIDCHRGAGQAYSDCFHSVEADQHLLDEQRMAKLAQERHYRMEHVLLQAAIASNIPCTAEVIDGNGYSYAYVANKSIGLTQSYVQKVGDKPSPAKFREQLAENQNIPLPFSDEIEIVFSVKSTYGVIAHNPAGNKFEKEQQSLGFIQICIPDEKFKTWVAQITLHEIIECYSMTKQAESTPKATPKLKQITTKLTKEE